MSLQELFDEFGCTVLNYTNNKIVVDYFYSEERYKNFLQGMNCRAGMGLHDADEKLVFNRVDDNKLVIVLNDGVETARYRYLPIFKATMECNDINSDNKKIKKTLTFRIRKNEFDGTINFIDTDKNSIDFKSVQAVKHYLYEKYGINKLIEWSVYDG